MSEPQNLGEHPLGARPVPARTVKVRLDFAYDGGPFSGWARQPGLTTVQGCLEEALAMVLREQIAVTVAGRTDAGVHAEHQVLHLRVSEGAWEALPGRHEHDSPEEALVRKANGALTRVLSQCGPPQRPGARPAEIGSILIRAARRVPEDFDARFSALERRYRYRIADGVERQSPRNRAWACWAKQELDPAVLNRAGEELLGLHDFLSFCKPREGATTVRELKELSFARGADGLIEATVRADAFCHSMVRALVGACLTVAEGRKDVAWLRERIEHPVRDSSVRLAPAEGLSLEHIEYPDDAAGWRERARTTRARRSGPAPLA